jgi:hypothetical protein
MDSITFRVNSVCGLTVSARTTRRRCSRRSRRRLSGQWPPVRQPCLATARERLSAFARRSPCVWAPPVSAAVVRPAHGTACAGQPSLSHLALSDSTLRHEQSGQSARDAMRCAALRCAAVRCAAVLCCVMRCDALRCAAVLCDAGCTLCSRCAATSCT